MRHLFECPMRWADLDLLGHVNNVVYVDYLQEARVDMLRVHAPDARAGRLADGVVVVRHDVEFVTPLGFLVGLGGSAERDDRVLGDRDPSRLLHDRL